MHLPSENVSKLPYWCGAEDSARRTHTHIALKQQMCNCIVFITLLLMTVPSMRCNILHIFRINTVRNTLMCLRVYTLFTFHPLSMLNFAENIIFNNSYNFRWTFSIRFCLLPIPCECVAGVRSAGYFNWTAQNAKCHIALGRCGPIAMATISTNANITMWPRNYGDGTKQAYDAHSIGQQNLII